MLTPRFLNIRLDGIRVEDPESHPHLVSVSCDLPPPTAGHEPSTLTPSSRSRTSLSAAPSCATSACRRARSTRRCSRTRPAARPRTQSRAGREVVIRYRCMYPIPMRVVRCGWGGGACWTTRVLDVLAVNRGCRVDGGVHTPSADMDETGLSDAHFSTLTELVNPLPPVWL